jgi:hypothetical protein
MWGYLHPPPSSQRLLGSHTTYQRYSIENHQLVGCAVASSHHDTQAIAGRADNVMLLYLGDVGHQRHDYGYGGLMSKLHVPRMPY